jgi:hypothetical protein
VGRAIELPGRGGHDGGPSGVGSAGWAGLTWWELCGAGVGFCALLEPEIK